MNGNFMLPAAVIGPMAGGVIAYFIGYAGQEAQGETIGKRERLRDWFAGIFVAAVFAWMLVLLAGYAGAGSAPGYVTYASLPGVCGLGLNFTVDGFRAVYGLIAAFMWMMTTIFSREYMAHSGERNRYYLFLLLTLGATEGVFFSADLYTTFIFFEVMSFTSYVWVAQDEKRASLRAAETYLAVAVIGGLVMLMGLFLLNDAVGTLRIGELLGAAQACPDKDRLYAAGLCLFFGFGAKAGAFPLHIWLPKAHPVAPAPASALLSGILTKAGMFGILVTSCDLFLYDARWGSFALVIGVLTMVTGAVLALFSVDLKRTLACSSVSQIGFILVGVGMQGLMGSDNGLAVRGSLLHMVNHSLFKLVLFMAAGVVVMNVHKLNLNEIRGFGRKKPLFNFIFLMGALGIGGIPLWNGYVSKTLIHESIVVYLEMLQKGVAGKALFGLGAMRAIEWLFLISGGLTVAYMLKLYVALFVEKNTDQAVQERFDGLKGRYMNKASAFALAGSAIWLPVLGVLPGMVMNRIAQLGQGFMHLERMEEAVHYFNLTNLRGGIISILIGAAVYLAVVRGWMMRAPEKGGRKEYVDRWPGRWDLEERVYRPLLLRFFPMVFGVVCRICDSLVDWLVVLLRRTLYRDSKLPHELEEGTMVTHVFGLFLDDVVHFLNRTLWRRKPRPEIYEHKLALKHEEIAEDETIIGRSLSFGLLLFCAGLVLTLVYLLWK